MEDSDRPTKITEAFDFSTEYIYPWEINKIRYAVEQDEVIVRDHAEVAMLDDDVDIDDCYHVVRYGKPKTKDLPYNNKGRVEGINFTGAIKDGRRLLVKIGWLKGYYEIVTVHKL